MDAFVFVCQLFVGAILLMSGVIKASDIAEFVVSVHKYALLPKQFERPAALAITAAELAAAILMLTGEGARFGAAIAVLLFVAFIAAVVRNIVKKVDIECGCFGLLWREKTGWATVGRDVVLLASAALVLIAGAGATLRDAADDPSGIVDVLPILSVTVVAAGAAWVARIAYRENAKVSAALAAPDNLPPPVHS